MFRHFMPVNDPRRRPPAGFTMIEVMVAMAIFAVGILAVFSMQIRAINQNAAARMQTEATCLAAQHLELLKTVPFDHDLLSADGDLNPHQAATGAFTLQWTVTTPTVAAADVYKDLPVKFVNLTVNCANPNFRPVQLFFVRGQGES